MKVFCLMLEPYINGAGLNFKSNLRPAALACFTKRENFKNFVAHEQAAKATNRAVGARSQVFEARAKAAELEAVSARRASYTCRGAKTASAMSIDRAASENILNFTARKHCADRKNFKIFASDEIKFTTHGELKFTMRGMVKFTACSWLKFATHGELKFATNSMIKFTARRGLKFEPCGTAARGFALRDKILSSRPRKNCVSFKISSRRGEKAK